MNAGLNDNYSNIIAAGWKYMGQYDNSAGYSHIYPSFSGWNTNTYTQVLIEDYNGTSYMMNDPRGEFMKPGLTHAITNYMDQNNAWQSCNIQWIKSNRAMIITLPAGSKTQKFGDYEFNESNTNNQYNYHLKFYIK